MTPLIPALAESAAWLCEAEGGGRRPALLQPADSWEWLTLAINTCRASCGAGSGLLAEEVVVVNEE